MISANWVGSANDRWTVPLVLARKMRRRLQLKMRRKTRLRIRSACRSRTTPFFNVGPYGRTENGVLIQPVIPFKLNEDWNVITRTIIPVIYQPQVLPSQGSDFGLGNINLQFFLSPARSGQIIWGFGPQLWLPTATNKALGVNKFGGGPAVVALTKRGHWLVGTLVGNVWAGSSGAHYNQMTITPLVFYNMQKGWYFMYVSMITANWVGSANDRWTVPVGAGFGRVFKVGRQPMKCSNPSLQ
jgi:hypothetical protein